jgi:hypothetical protein
LKEIPQVPSALFRFAGEIAVVGKKVRAKLNLKACRADRFDAGLKRARLDTPGRRYDPNAPARFQAPGLMHSHATSPQCLRASRAAGHRRPVDNCRRIPHQVLSRAFIFAKNRYLYKFFPRLVRQNLTEARPRDDLTSRLAPDR